MERRRLLRILAGAVAGLAGCARAGRPSTGTASPSPTQTPPAGSVANVDLPVPAEQLERSVRRDGIPAITEPAIGSDWSGVELTTRDQFGNEKTIQPRLSDSDRVLGVERGGAARAYPLRLLNWHEIVNDTPRCWSRTARSVAAASPPSGGFEGSRRCSGCRASSGGRTS